VSDLANNIQGEHFSLPATAAYWRVRRLKEGRGAPEVVFGADGVPLLVAVETDFDAFRAAVDDQPGRYRLDALDEARRPIEGLPAAYVAVPMRVGRSAAEPSPEAPPVAPAYVRAAAVPSPVGGHDSLLAEVIRGQNQLVALMTERFSGIMVSAAELLRVFPHQVLTAPLTPPPPAPPPSYPTPGPGPRNAGSYDPAELEPDAADSDDEPDDDGDAAPPESGLVATMTAVNNIVGEVMPVVKLFMAHRMAKDSARPMPRNAAPPVPAPAAPAPPPEPPCGPLSLAELRHLDAIDNALTPGEARRHQLVTDDLPATDRRAWFDTLCSLDVPDAVALIRRHIARAQRMAPGRSTVSADPDIDLGTPSADGNLVTPEPFDQFTTEPTTDTDESTTDTDEPTFSTLDREPTTRTEPPEPDTYDPGDRYESPCDLPGVHCAHCGEPPTACACGEPLVLTPEMIAHAMAVQAALTPVESTRVLALAGEMPDDERDAWMAELSTFTVADAVQAVREALASLDGTPVPERLGPLRLPEDSGPTAPFLATPEPSTLPVDTATARSLPAPASPASATPTSATPTSATPTALALMAPAVPESP
jgi:hypothetical protein